MKNCDTKCVNVRLLDKCSTVASFGSSRRFFVSIIQHFRCHCNMKRLEEAFADNLIKFPTQKKCATEWKKWKIGVQTNPSFVWYHGEKRSDNEKREKTVHPKTFEKEQKRRQKCAYCGAIILVNMHKIGRIYVCCIKKSSRVNNVTFFIIAQTSTAIFGRLWPN